MKILAALALSLLVLTGCATSEEISKPNPVATPSINVDETFLRVLRDKVPGTQAVSDQTLLSLAGSICENLRSGASVLEVARVGVDAGLTARDSGYIVGASIAAYCPEQKSKINDATSTNSV